MKWFIGMLVFAGVVWGQSSLLPPVRIPDASPKEIVAHEIGLTDVVITYHSPRVNERKIWGGLVPYGVVWRTGANENTTISFQNDVKINGQALSAGTYGFHAMPTEKEWTLIFSKNSTSWGSFSYDSTEDALRIKVVPEPLAAPYEWLKYEFNNPTMNSAEISLRWEKLKVSFNVETNTTENTLAMFRREFLRGTRRFDWSGWWYAAQWCYNNNVNLDEALKWIDRSISTGTNFINLKLKADILKKQSKEADAKKVMDQALRIGTPYDVAGYVNGLVREKQNQPALEIAMKLVKNYPDISNVTGAAARACSANGKFSDALKYAKTTLELASEGAKPYWETAVKKLQDGKDMN